MHVPADWSAAFGADFFGRVRYVRPFNAPPGLAYAEIDRDTGGLATPDCPRTINEAFLPGTEPRTFCTEHGGHGVERALSSLGSWLKRIIRR